MPKNHWFFGMNLGQLQSAVLRKLWQQFEEDDDGSPYNPTVAFSKYSEYRVNQKLNYTLALLGKFGVRSWFVITLKQDYSQYNVPPNCVDIEKVWYFSSATTYDELPVRERNELEDLIPGWMTISGIPEYAYPADWFSTIRKLGVAPAPLLDGTAITLASGVYQREGAYAAVEGVEGSAGAGSATNTYVDSEGQDFGELGVIIGQNILNVSDDSQGVITSLATTNTTNDTLICSAGLSGGLNNVWAPADEMRLLATEYGGVITSGETDADYLIAPNIGQFPWPGLTLAQGNVLVEHWALPMLMREKTQYPELFPLFHNALVLGAAAELAEEEPLDSPEFAQGKVYRERFSIETANIEATMRAQYKSSFRIWGQGYYK
jgi:hypothetical protein